jgi:hypothetical protein
LHSVRALPQRSARHAVIAHDLAFAREQSGAGGLLDQRAFVAHARHKHVAQIEDHRTPVLGELTMNRDGSKAATDAAVIGGLLSRAAPTVGTMFGPSAATSPSTVTRQTTHVWPMILASSGPWSTVVMLHPFGWVAVPAKYS